MAWFLLGALAYFCGSIPFGKIVAARYGIDIQKRGSGNIGFANVYRVVGRRPAYLVLAGDVLKGFLPALLALAVINNRPQALYVSSLAIVGHVLPVWLGFRGGKGVATAFGVNLAVYSLIALGGLAVYVITRLITHRSAIGSLAAAISLPLLGLWLEPNVALFYGLLCLGSVWTHRANIRAFGHTGKSV